MHLDLELLQELVQEGLNLLDKYIGIPFVDRKSTFQECDCFGLIRLLYKNEMKIDVAQPLSSAYETKKVYNEYLKEIASNWKEVKEPEMFDVVGMAHDTKHPDIVQHFGIYIGNGKMIHTLEEIGSHIVDLEEYKYFIKGFYRWQK